MASSHGGGVEPAPQRTGRLRGRHLRIAAIVATVLTLPGLVPQFVQRSTECLNADCVSTTSLRLPGLTTWLLVAIGWLVWFGLVTGLIALIRSVTRD